MAVVNLEFSNINLVVLTNLSVNIVRYKLLYLIEGNTNFGVGFDLFADNPFA